MATKFLIIGDPHFKTSNIPDSEDFIQKTIDVVKTNNPDFIIILGDVLHEHERLHTIPLNKAYDFIKSMSELTKTYVLVGNHDMINNQQFLNHNHWMNSMKEWYNTIIVDKPTILQHNNNIYVLCPYVPNGRFKEALDTITDSNNQIDWKNAKLIFSHQEFLNCKMGAIISQDGDQWDKSLPPIISGHIHHNQKLLDGHIYYPGSAMQNAFGDPNNIIAMITILDYDDMQKSNVQLPYVLNEIDLMLRKKKIVYHDLDNIDNLDVEKLINSKDLIKLTVHGTYDDYKIFTKTQISKELTNNGIVIVHKNKKPNIINNNDCIDGSDDPSDSSDINCSKESSESSEAFIFDSDDSLEQLVHTFVVKEANPILTSDFNYIFLGYDKDQQLLLI